MAAKPLRQSTPSRGAPATNVNMDFNSTTKKAVEAADLALCDILTAHSAGDRIDTKTLKDITAALKDLGGILSDEGGADRTVTVQFIGAAGDAAV